MRAKLTRIIKFVDNMENAIQFYSGTLGLPLLSHASDWTEFDTGETVLALHPATATRPAGSCELNFTVVDVQSFYEQSKDRGVRFSSPPAQQLWGSTMAEMVDSDGTPCSVSSS
jgi:uncharacterized glyoxalase superfamily protein PhnB